jgi:hypothetical protein
MFASVLDVGKKTFHDGGQLRVGHFNFDPFPGGVFQIGQSGATG